MALICVEATVADYSKWRTHFDSNADVRAAAGLNNPRIFRDADNGNHIFVIAEAADPAKARRALEGSDYRARMQESGSAGTVKIYTIE